MAPARPRNRKDAAAPSYSRSAGYGGQAETQRRKWCYVVIARVKPQYAKLETRVYLEQTVEARRFAVPATVVKMPFFDPPRKRE